MRFWNIRNHDCVDLQVAVQLDGAHTDVPRPDGVIVLATERKAVKTAGATLGGMIGGPMPDGSARHGTANGGDVEMGVRPSQHSEQNGTRDRNSGGDHQIAVGRWSAHATARVCASADSCGNCQTESVFLRWTGFHLYA